MSVESIITENLGIWTSAIKTKSASGRGSSNKLELYGIKKLRELILELAVRGKLVQQNPSEVNASVLLNQIESERNRLVKDKQIRKPKNLPIIDELEKPFDIPSSWQFCRLNDLGEWGAGSTPRRGESSFYDGDIPWFKSGELRADYIETSEETVSALALKNTSLRLNSEGDVLVAMYGATIGKASILKVQATTNQAVCACTPFSGMFNEFLLLLLKAYRNRFIEMGAGGAQPNISREKIIATVVPLPPKEEQFRIVKKVSELMTLCDQLELKTEASIEAHQTLVKSLLETLTNAKDADELNESWQRISEHFDVLFTTEDSIDQLKQTILQLAVMGKLVKQDPNDEPASKLLERIAAEKELLIKDNKIKKQKPLAPITDDEISSKLPNDWIWCRLNEIISIMDAGWSPACPPEPSPSSDKWGVLKTTAVQKLEFLENENKVLAESKDPKAQYEVKSRDILITRAGPRNRVGISCLVRNTRPRLMISDKIIRFHLVHSDLDEEFISLCLNSGVTAEYLEKSKSGMADSQVNISQDKLKMAPIPLAPLRQQREIVTKVYALWTLCEKLKLNVMKLRDISNCVADSLIVRS